MKITNTNDFITAISFMGCGIIGIIFFIENLGLLSLFVIMLLMGIVFLFTSIELKGEKHVKRNRPKKKNL